ncbi:pentatricopeptide repeat (PPR) superfamily protein [Actinidia rufa]|uniref:Pentatricopeptide repeat (PPR) superfamily protein n=1 Tax=Actinidia rufa TaxID=165716 RepID=A0A7J0ER41_9ERIC|nr:pentatricopeptide repeat (PPR) superfamily protein [Actinidia rufa]
MHVLESERRCIEGAVWAFGDLPGPNEVSFTAMKGMLAESDRIEEAFSMFRSMVRTGIRIDSVWLSSVLGVCARGGAGEFCDSSETCGIPSCMHGQQIHGLTVKLGFERDLHLINSLLDMYAKKGDLDSAEIVFHYLSEVSVVSWNIMIGGYGQRHQTDKAVEHMRRMRSQGFEPDKVTHINMLAACIRYSQSENQNEAIRFSRETQFRGVRPDRTTLAVVLSSCVGMGLLEGRQQTHAMLPQARKYFDEMPCKNIVIWNEMIHGYAHNGCGDEAVTLYEDMIESGQEPDGINALGHAGRFDEADVLIGNMPYKDDPIIWEVLLGFCRVHASSSQYIFIIMIELFRLDPHNSAPCVLLANLYSSLRRWEGGQMVRKMMSDKQVLKNPGYSWVEHKNRMQVFKVDDDFKMTFDAFEEPMSRLSCFNG